MFVLTLRMNIIPLPPLASCTLMLKEFLFEYAINTPNVTCAAPSPYSSMFMFHGYFCKQDPLLMLACCWFYRCWHHRLLLADEMSSWLLTCILLLRVTMSSGQPRPSQVCLLVPTETDECYIKFQGTQITDRAAQVNCLQQLLWNFQENNTMTGNPQSTWTTH